MHIPDDGDGSPRPAVVYAHGGGFFTGTKSMGPWRFLLDAGYAVASIDYRLSGECRFPGPVHDAAAAVRWVRANAAAYGLDPGRIAGFGSSAGGYLLNAVALASGDAGLVGALGPTPEVSCALAAVVDHYAPTDFLHIDEDAPDDVIELSNAPGTSASRLFGFIPAEHPEQAEVSTLSRYTSPGSPPFLIAHGDADRRVGIGQSRRLHTALTEAGADAELIVVPGADHGGPEFDERPLHDATLAFLRRVLGDHETACQPGISAGRLPRRDGRGVHAGVRGDDHGGRASVRHYRQRVRVPVT
ncbi:alpha/beta fold hydrolase [Nonomuraea thailandensis]